MQIETILNRIEKQAGFVYERCEFGQDDTLPLEITLRSRRGNLSIYAGCGRRGPGYDTLPQQRFEYVPLWGILVFLLYSSRRVDCPRCGKVRAEETRELKAKGKEPVLTKSR